VTKKVNKSIRQQKNKKQKKRQQKSKKKTTKNKKQKKKKKKDKRFGIFTNFFYKVKSNYIFLFIVFIPSSLNVVRPVLCPCDGVS
jgi:high-affinity Fe2+/Pb2+ permease